MSRIPQTSAALISIALLLGTVDLAAQSAPTPAKPASPGASAAASPAPSPTPIPLPEVVAEADSTSNTLRNIDRGVASDEVKNTVQLGVSTLSQEIDARMIETDKVLVAVPSLEMLDDLDTGWRDLADDAQTWSRNLTRRATELDAQLTQLTQLGQTWQTTLAQAKSANAPPEILDRITGVIGSVQQTRNGVESHRTEILSLQSRLAAQQARIDAIRNAIRQARETAANRLLVRDSPPLWALGSAAASAGTELTQTGGMTLSAQVVSLRAYLQRQPGALLIHAGLIALLVFALRWARQGVQRWVEQDPELQRSTPIFEVPICAAIAVSALFIGFIYPQAPRLLRVLLGAVLLVPTTIMLRRLIERRHVPLLYATITFWTIDEVRVLLASLPAVARGLFTLETIAGLLLAVWVLKRERRAPGLKGRRLRSTWPIPLYARMSVAALSAALLADALGFVGLANLLGGSFLRGAYAAVVIYAAVRVVEGLTAVALETRPLAYLRMVQKHRPMLRRRVLRVSQTIGVLFWLSAFLDMLQMRTPLVDWSRRVLNATLAVGSLQLSLGHVLAFGVAIWASLLLSQFLRFLLEEDLYDRFKLPRGLPYAISTLLHYVILLIGFFAGLAALGVDMTKFTILAGAFSVGIGFGLQNIINNFVSGLILLFERPIKVGDVIQVDSATGSVERIGIRASIIRTIDGSEVIIPNGTLISSQVTNWTFSDRQRVVAVQVGVARESDASRAVQLLKEVAEAHPRVAKHPAPQAYVVTLSAGSLTLELRAWTERYEDWVQIRSDLVSGINQSLARESITLA